MNKIYSRPRIKIPRIVIQGGTKLNSPKGKKTIKIFLVLVIAFSIVKLVLDAVYPIFDTLCESKAKSIATIISNEQATNVMKRYSYDDMFILEKDSNNNVTMVRSNVISINEIISDVANKIQEEINKKGRDNIEIAIRKLHRI